MLVVESYTLCECGAVTFHYEDGNDNSIKKENLGIYGLQELYEDSKFSHFTYGCNHCVNHYGLDLCSCGSGESPNECKGGYSECGTPYQTLGKSVEFLPKF